MIPVSVVIPCYCCALTIERAVNSVFAQTCPPTELILVEDGSPDGGATADKLAELRVKWQKSATVVEIVCLENNRGASAARNVGWQRASQPYIAFLDADDSWLDSKLELQYEWMQQNPEYAVTAHQCAIAGNGSLDESSSSAGFGSHSVTLSRFLFTHYYPTPAVMLKRELAFRFNENWRFAEDYLLWLEILYNGHKLAFLEVTLATLYKNLYGDAGLSGQLWAMEKAELAVYRYYYRQGRLGIFAFGFLAIWSISKFAVRIAAKTWRTVRNRW